eukprot:scaffold32997_cov101-Isochrysis_galbana.AAC.1
MYCQCAIVVCHWSRGRIEVGKGGAARGINKVGGEPGESCQNISSEGSLRRLSNRRLYTK